MTDRLRPGIFALPIPELRIGDRSAVYFNRLKQIMRERLPDKGVTMQVFQKNNSVLCGIDEAIAVLKVGAGYFTDQAQAEKHFVRYLQLKHLIREERHRDIDQFRQYLLDMVDVECELDALWVSTWNDLEVKALSDGDEIAPREPVLQIRGPLQYFGHLESVYLGVLARRTRVASNVARVVEVCNDKPLLFFADRFDHFENQGGDGYAAYIGGAGGVATNSMGAWWGEQGMGTMPHALIAAYDGDCVAATKAFHETFPNVPLISLVDFNNDCVLDSVNCYREFGDALWGVRLDTSETMVDKSIRSQDMGEEKPTGVNQILVNKVRHALNGAGGENVKIVVSGGFNVEKITAFEKAEVPVDAYAVGESLLLGSNAFTADVVQPVAKEGRWFRDDSRLMEVL